MNDEQFEKMYKQVRNIADNIGFVGLGIMLCLIGNCTCSTG